MQVTQLLSVQEVQTAPLSTALLGQEHTPSISTKVAAQVGISQALLLRVYPLRQVVHWVVLVELQTAQFLTLASQLLLTQAPLDNTNGEAQLVQVKGLLHLMQFVMLLHEEQVLAEFRKNPTEHSWQAKLLAIYLHNLHPGIETEQAWQLTLTPVVSELTSPTRQVLRHFPFLSVNPLLQAEQPLLLQVRQLRS